MMLKRYLSRAHDDAVVKVRRIEELGPEYRFTKYFDIFGGTVFRGLMKADGDVKSVIDSIVANARKEYGDLVVDVLLRHFNQQEESTRDFEKSLISVFDPKSELRLFDLDPPFLERLDLRDEYYKMAMMRDDEVEEDQQLLKEQGEDEFAIYEQLRTVQDVDYLVHTEALLDYWAIDDNYEWEVSNFITNCISSALCARGEIPTDREHVSEGTLLHIAYYNSRVKTTPSLASRFFAQERERILKCNELKQRLKVVKEDKCTEQEKHKLKLGWSRVLDLHFSVEEMTQLRNYFVLDLAAALQDWNFIKELYHFILYVTKDQPGFFLNNLSKKTRFLKSLLIHGDLELYEMFFQTTALTNKLAKQVNVPTDAAAVQRQKDAAYQSVWNSNFMILHVQELDRQLIRAAALHAPLAIWERILQDPRVNLDSRALLDVLVLLTLSAFGDAANDGFAGAETRLRVALRIQNRPFTMNDASSKGEVSEQRLSALLDAHLDTNIVELFVEEQLD